MWAKIVDCGDAPLTFLDNTVALKQLDKAHKVGISDCIYGIRDILPYNLEPFVKTQTLSGQNLIC